mmetsp:Transcript_51982/g.95176  ORF Transcript_51982/g.95176 Transcript_51982/m.95176 type:complete len:230 (+) Transcript_51982:610-1299(+)
MARLVTDTDPGSCGSGSCPALTARALAPLPSGLAGSCFCQADLNGGGAVDPGVEGNVVREKPRCRFDLVLLAVVGRLPGRLDRSLDSLQAGQSHALAVLLLALMGPLPARRKRWLESEGGFNRSEEVLSPREASPLSKSGLRAVTSSCSSGVPPSSACTAERMHRTWSKSRIPARVRPLPRKPWAASSFSEAPVRFISAARAYCGSLHSLEINSATSAPRQSFKFASSP